MADVFISYSHADRDLACSMAKSLKAVGASVWWDRELIAGDDFDATILRELTASSCVIVVWTENSIASRYVRGEAATAAQQNKLIPVVREGIEPSLGFRTLHMLRLGRTEAEDKEFVRSLKRAVEERIGKTLRFPRAAKGSGPKTVQRSPPVVQRSLPLSDSFRAIAVTDSCIWLGTYRRLEVRDTQGGTMLGSQAKAAEALFPMPAGDEIMCYSSSIGYQAPDSIRVERCALSGSLEEVRRRNREAEDYVPDSGDYSTREGRVERVRNNSILSDTQFVTWAWQPGLVDVSDDAQCVGVYVDDPAEGVQLWSAPRSATAPTLIPLGDCHPDQILLLSNGGGLVTVEYHKTNATSLVSLWNRSSRRCVAQHSLEYKTINSLCRTGRDGLVALGLDQSIGFLNVLTGTIEGQIQLDSRPVRDITCHKQSNTLGLLTDEELVVIDFALMRVLRTMKHSGLKGVACGLNGQVMAAVVTEATEKSELVIWSFTVG